MYLTKLSRKYHLLNKEERLKNNPNCENISKEDNQDVQVNKELKRPSTPEVIVISTTSSSSDSEKNGNVSEIINGFGLRRHHDDDNDTASTVLRLPTNCKRTSCAGWKRLESTHIDHIDEVGGRNISLWTDDMSAIQEAADHSTSFETARTHITSKPQGTSNNNVINKRRSLLGRNEVILLTSDSDSSDNDDEKKATRIQPNRTQRNNSRRNVVVEHNSPSNDGRECLLSYMSESRIASVERWIVSSPFASSATSTTRKSFGIRLEDVEIGASDEILHKSKLSTQTWDSSEATSKRFSEKVSSSITDATSQGNASEQGTSNFLRSRFENVRKSLTKMVIIEEEEPDEGSEATSKRLWERQSVSRAATESSSNYPASQATSKRFLDQYSENYLGSQATSNYLGSQTTSNYRSSQATSNYRESQNRQSSETYTESQATSKRGFDPFRSSSEKYPESQATSKQGFSQFRRSQPISLHSSSSSDSNQSRKKSFGAQVSLSESSYTSVIHETASPNQISSTSVVQETLMTSQRESVAHKSLQVSMTSSDESEGVSVDKVSMTSSEKSNDESAKSSESLVVKVLTTTSDERSSPESNGNEKSQMETSQPTQSTFGPGCRRNIFGNVLFLSDGEDSENDNVSKQISQEKENRNNIIISSTSSNDDDSSHIELDQKVLRRSGRRRLGPIILDSDDSDDMISLRTPKYLPIETSPFVTTKRRHGSVTGGNSTTKIEETPTTPIVAKSSGKEQTTPLRTIENMSTPKTPSLNKFSTPKGPIPLSVARSPFFSTGKNVTVMTPKTPLPPATKKTPTSALKHLNLNSRSPFLNSHCTSQNNTPSPAQRITSTPSTSKQITTTLSSPYQSPNQFSSHYHSPSINHDSFNDFDVDSPTTPTPLKTPRSCLKEDDFKTPTVVEGKLSFLASLSLDEPNERCHPDAVKYITRFARTKQMLLEKLFKLFNEKGFDSRLPTNLSITWNPRLTKTAGVCIQRRIQHIGTGKEERLSRIELSTKVLDSADRLRDTLIHEMCHASSWVVSGYRDGHGPVWKAWAKKVMDRFPELPIIARCHAYSIRTKFNYRCTKCHYQVGRHSKSIDIAKKCCGLCRGRFELIVNGKVVEPAIEGSTTNSVNAGASSVDTPKNRFAAFVKENYRNSRTPGKTHAEAMKALSQQFAETKLKS